MKGQSLIALGGALLIGMTGVARAEMTGGQASEQAKVAALEARITQLEAQQSSDWLNQRRAEEMKSLIQEVLSDADTRASLLESHMTAGHNGKHFFLASEDATFLLEISGQIQLRYVYNHRDEKPGTDEFGDPTSSIVSDEDEFGFEVRRTKIKFAGHIADPKLHYAIQLAVDRQDNHVEADKIVIAYELMDGVTLWGGEDKGPFLREELTRSSRQLAVDRTFVNEFFTLDKVQGVGLKADIGDAVKGHVMVNDGLRSGDGGTSVNPFTQGAPFSGPGTDEFGETGDDLGTRSTTKRFHEDASDFAVTARIDLRLAGEWSQMEDFAAWSGEDTGLFVGAALHYEVGETGDSFNNNDFFMWTIDGSLETNGFNLFAAVVGMHTDNDGRQFDPATFDLVDVHDVDL